MDAGQDHQRPVHLAAMLIDEGEHGGEVQLPANRRCPVARSLELLSRKWNLLIVRELSYGT